MHTLNRLKNHSKLTQKLFNFIYIYSLFFNGNEDLNSVISDFTLFNKFTKNLKNGKKALKMFNDSKV